MSKIRKLIAIFLMGFFLLAGSVGCGSPETVSTVVPTSIQTPEITSYKMPETTIAESTTTTVSTTSTILQRGSQNGPYKVSTTTTKKPTSIPTTPTTKYVAPTTQATVAQSYSGNSFLECVKNHEIATAGGYSAVNPSSGAGGAYQLLPSTWNNVANHIGRGDLVGIPPHQASPATQDMMAMALLNWYGRSPWNGTGC